MRTGVQGLRGWRRAAPVTVAAVGLLLTAGACPAPPIESDAVDRARVDALLAADPGLASTEVSYGGGGVGSVNLRYRRPSITVRGTLVPAHPAGSLEGLTAKQVLAADEGSAVAALRSTLEDLRRRGWVVTSANCEVIASVGTSLHRSWLVEARRPMASDPKVWALLQLSAAVSRNYGSADLSFPRVEMIQQARLPFHLDEPNVFAPPSGLPAGGLTSTCADQATLPSANASEGSAFPPLVDGPPR